MVAPDHLFTPGGTGSVPSHKSVDPYNKEKNGTARRPSLPEKDCCQQCSESDLGGCGPSQPREPIKPNIGRMPCRGKQSLHRPARRRGTGRPPGLGKSSNGPPCLPREGRTPSRPINQLALITRKKMGQHGGHPSLKKWLWTHVNANGTKLASAGH